MKVHAEPVNQKLWTKGFTVGVVLIVIGMLVLFDRFVNGLGAVTNLSDGYPWGIWIVFDVVTGIGLAAGGFTMAGLVYVLNKGKYSPLMRPALLTALMGYGLAAFAIVIDVGRWWQIYNPALPQNWQGNSPLFEVSLCVMSYLTVLVLEFIPILTEKWKTYSSGFLKKFADFAEPLVSKILLFLIILGITISCLHQSSLGALFLIAPHKQHALWHTPWSPLMFLISAIAVGYPMVVFESVLSRRTFNRKSETRILGQLTAITPWILGVYLALKIFDLAYYGEFGLLFADKFGALFIVENLIFAVIPIIMLSMKSVRSSERGLFTASFMIVFGLILNRFSVYLFSFTPRPGFSYFPSMGELAVTGMMISILFVVYKIVVTKFPVLVKEPA